MVKVRDGGETPRCSKYFTFLKVVRLMHLSRFDGFVFVRVERKA